MGRTGGQPGVAGLCFWYPPSTSDVLAEQRGCAAQEALRRYKDEVAADPDTESGFYYNTNAQNQTKQYVLVGLLCPV